MTETDCSTDSGRTTATDGSGYRIAVVNSLLPMDRSTALVSSLLQWVYCAGGLVANALVAATIVRYRKSAFSSPFYILALVVAVPDVMFLCTQVFCGLPAVMYDIGSVSKVFLASCGFFATSAFWNFCPLMLVIAVNRYMSVCFFDVYRTLFTTKVVWWLVAVCVFLSAAVPALMYSCTCLYDYSNAWVFRCTGGCKNEALMFNNVVANSICVAIVLVYVITAFQYRRVQRRVASNLRNDDVKRRNKERLLMFQFALISSVMVFNQIFFWFFTYVIKNNGTEIILNVIACSKHIVSPICYLLFGSEIRNRMPWRKQAIVGSSAVLTVQVKVSDIPSGQHVPTVVD